MERSDLPDVMYSGDIRVALAFPNEDMEIMQFTGLKDKNREEIYEGDILYLEPTMFAVIWNDEDAGFTLENKFAKSWIPRSQKSRQIIGNIYENSELLKEKRS